MRRSDRERGRIDRGGWSVPLPWVALLSVATLTFCNAYDRRRYEDFLDVASDSVRSDSALDHGAFDASDALEDATTPDAPVDASPADTGSVLDGGDPCVPVGVTCADVGSPARAGSCMLGVSSLLVSGGGSDIWNFADQFHYAYVSRSGDIDAIVDATSLSGAEDYAKLGVMIRASLDPASAHAMVNVTPRRGVYFTRRVSPGGDSTSDLGSNAAAPRWLRIVRTGDLFEALESADGASWSTIGASVIPMPRDVLVGVAITSHNAADLATGTVGAMRFCDAGAARDAGPTAVDGGTDATSDIAFDAPSADVPDASPADAPFTDAFGPDGTASDSGVVEHYWDLTARAIGFAQGVTGGYSPTSPTLVVVTNDHADTSPGSLGAALASASGPTWIRFTPGATWDIHLASPIYLASNITIDGRGANITISGSTVNVFTAASAAVHNVILENLRFENTVMDRNAIVVDFGSYDLWIDHCTFRNNSTGTLGQPMSIDSIPTGGGTGITLSWNHFGAPNIKSVLVGSGDARTWNSQMRITFDHNYFDGVDARNPRVRHATIDYRNNYLRGWVEYGVVVVMSGNALVRGNVFEATTNSSAVLTTYTGDPAASVADVGNLLVGSPTPVIQTTGTFPMGSITYTTATVPADMSLIDAIVVGAGWQDVPFPPG